MEIGALIIDNLNVAWLMMRAKPARTALSLLGVYIGMLALITILTIHEETRQTIEDLYRTQNARIFLVMPAFDPITTKLGFLTMEHVAQFKAMPGILSVLPRTHQQCNARSQNHSMDAQIIGIDTDFLSVYRIPLQQGRTFLEREIMFRQPLCLLTDRAADHLFPFKSAIGKFVAIQGIGFEVIGIVKWSPAVTQRTSSSADPDILVPATWTNIGKSAQTGPMLFPMVEVRASLDVPSQQVIQEISDVLSHGSENRAQLYSIASLDDYLQKVRLTTSQTLKSLLAIAAISLVVGGIGIANVMLMSVIERTREIGIRKALGARRNDIILQFLLESIVLTGSAGVLAVLTGGVGTALIPLFSHSTSPLAFPKIQTVACVALTIAIGLIAGAYPAARAAMLAPVDALRYE